MNIIRPDLSARSGDAALCGTAVHLAIESTLNGEGLSTDELTARMYDRIVQEIADPGVKWAKFESVNELLGHAVRCFDAWRTHIYPWMIAEGLTGGRCEVPFQVPLFTLPDGRSVGIEGTIDYLPPTKPMILDWKNIGKAYKPWEKQRYEVQPTIYTMACVLGGVDEEGWDVTYDWPMDFFYGIAVRGVKRATPQLVRVTRTAKHARFAIDRIASWVDLALNYGLERAWPRDDSHYLCSEKWCDFWTECKGKHLSWEDDATPVQVELSTPIDTSSTPIAA